MEQFLLYFVVSLIAFLSGWHVRQMTALHLIRRREERYHEYQRSMILRTHLRYDNEIFYVYNSDNHAFLTQAKNKQEIVEFFKATYPEKKVIMDESDIELLEKHGV